MNRKETEDQNCLKLISDMKKMSGDENSESKQFYEECKNLYNSSKVLVTNLKNVLHQINRYYEIDDSFINSIESVASIVEGMRKINTFKTANAATSIESHRIVLWKSRLFVEKLAITKLANDLVVQLLDSALIESVLRLAYLCNEMLIMNLSGELRSINVYTNTCPMLLYPLRKFSMNRILQILATRRAENCSYQVIYGLLSKYFEPEEDIPPNSGLTEEFTQTPEVKDGKKDDEKNVKNTKLLVAQNSVSSNTSVEIYRALTKHLETKGKDGEILGNQPMDILCRNEEKRARILLTLSARIAPQLLGTNLITSSKTSGRFRLKSCAKNKLTNYYQQMLWGEVGGYLEHILLWWNADPLGSFSPALCQNLKDYIVELKTTGDSIPSLLMPSINSLLDAMSCHLTSTSWDQLFRKTLVSAANVKQDVYKGYDIEGSATGQLFVEMFTDLINLNNSCENQYLNLEDLPLVEQIPIMHRLDHSVHTVRLWSSNRCRNLASKWNLDEFYCTCHTDISKCLLTLRTAQLTDHGEIPPNTSVQVTVCVKMRAKLVSEIRENIEKLKRTAGECIEVLAKNCRTECLAILHMTFPDPLYWKQNGPLPDCASDYVQGYLDCILRPVFLATNKMALEIQQSSSAMVLRILCESWLEYVYLHRIKFSEWGAVQLLTDFGAVPTWLMERVQLPKDLLNSLISHEVLRRCEGVGRLLLRRRGESIKMTAPLLHKTANDESCPDNMPAEMYVPNQEQWLELRAPIKNNICCQL